MKKILILALIFVINEASGQIIFEEKLSKKAKEIKANSHDTNVIEENSIRRDTIPEVGDGMLPPTFSTKRYYGDFIALSQGLPGSLIKEIITSEIKKNKTNPAGNIFMFRDGDNTYVIFVEHRDNKWLVRELFYNDKESSQTVEELRKPSLNLSFSDIVDDAQPKPQKGYIVFGKKSN